jgi:hypothetical protein
MKSVKAHTIFWENFFAFSITGIILDFFLFYSMCEKSTVNCLGATSAKTACGGVAGSVAVAALIKIQERERGF